MPEYIFCSGQENYWSFCLNNLLPQSVDLVEIITQRSDWATFAVREPVRYQKHLLLSNPYSLHKLELLSFATSIILYLFCQPSGVYTRFLWLLAFLIPNFVISAVTEFLFQDCNDEKVTFSSFTKLIFFCLINNIPYNFSDAETCLSLWLHLFQICN